MENEGIEVYCDFCQEVAGELSFDDSLEDQKIKCQVCTKAVYWFSCSVCDTGWCTSNPVKKCIECK